MRIHIHEYTHTRADYNYIHEENASDTVENNDNDIFIIAQPAV